MSKHYVIDENHNFVEGYSAQEVLSVLEQAIADGSLKNVVAGQAIVDKLKCCVTGGTMQVAFVTQAKYNELKSSGNIIENCLYHITDDTTASDIEASLIDHNAKLYDHDAKLASLGAGLSNLGIELNTAESEIERVEGLVRGLYQHNITVTIQFSSVHGNADGSFNQLSFQLGVTNTNEYAYTSGDMFTEILEPNKWYSGLVIGSNNGRIHYLYTSIMYNGSNIQVKEVDGTVVTISYGFASYIRDEVLQLKSVILI